MDGFNYNMCNVLKTKSRQKEESYDIEIEIDEIDTNLKY